MHRDQQATTKETQDKIRREAVAAAKRAHNKWREDQLAQRREENEAAKRKWEAECEKLKRAGEEVPRQGPKQARKAAAPERLTQAVEKAQQMIDEDVNKLQDIVREKLTEEDWKQAILEALEDIGSESDEAHSD